jgi:hypothetical protein
MTDRHPSNDVTRLTEGKQNSRDRDQWRSAHQGYTIFGLPTCW